jgi:hypothetical protein
MWASTPYLARSVSVQHGAELVGDVAPPGVCQSGAFLGLRSADPGGNDLPLRPAGMGEFVAGGVIAAALPGAPQHLRHGHFQPLMAVGENKVHAGQATPLQRAQPVEPEGFRLRTADRHAGHLGSPSRPASRIFT